MYVMGEKESFLVESLSWNVDRNRKYCLVNIRVIIASDKNDQSVLKTGGKSLKSDEIFTLSQSISLQDTC